MKRRLAVIFTVSSVLALAAGAASAAVKPHPFDGYRVKPAPFDGYQHAWRAAKRPAL